MDGPRRFRAALFTLLVASLLLTGAGHVVLHGAHAAHGDETASADGCGAAHGELPAQAPADQEQAPADDESPDGDESDGHCVLCHLQLVGGLPAVAAVSTPLPAAPADELGPEAPHAASTRGRAAPRAPPVRA